MIILKKDRLIKAIASETGDANVIACLDEYGNALSAKADYQTRREVESLLGLEEEQ